ncbi:unnamed protein product [Symbiodinium microadriaticum]|nr:unnamed protein product [Symbiodinium microadriaticum]
MSLHWPASQWCFHQKSWKSERGVRRPSATSSETSASWQRQPREGCGPRRYTNGCRPPGPCSTKWPDRLFYDVESYTGVHTCGGPVVQDKENDPDLTFKSSLRPQRARSATVRQTSLHSADF